MTQEEAGSSILKAIAFARAGAPAMAWRCLDALDPDQGQTSAALSLRGRLLKDRALSEGVGEARRALFLASADAYRRAAGANDTTYPLINAAAMTLLSGDRSGACLLAERVLARLDRGIDDETPYYLEATRAEALLLSGDVAAAKSSLSAAIRLAPRAWEDHASTLRQFTSLLPALGEDVAWLDACRPPRTAHFCGAMVLGGDEGQLAALLDDLIVRERIGFGYGALAAGADIVVAERLLAAGAALHVILPINRADFVSRSIPDNDGDWRARFEAVLEQAETVEEGGAVADADFGTAVLLGNEIAMGRAARAAARLESEAVQIILAADDRAMGNYSASASRIWQASGRRQIVLGQSGVQEQPIGAAPEKGGITAFLTAELAIGFGSDAVGAGALPVLADTWPAIATVLAARPPARAPVWSGSALLIGFSDVQDAAHVALAIVAALLDVAQVRIASHYGIGHAARSSWPGEPLVIRPDMAMLEHLAGSMPPGAIYVSEPFADALAAARSSLSTELIGEIPGNAGQPGMAIHVLGALRA